MDVEPGFGGDRVERKGLLGLVHLVAVRLQSLPHRGECA